MRMDIRTFHALKIHAMDLLFVGFRTIIIEFDYLKWLFGFLQFKFVLQWDNTITLNCNVYKIIVILCMHDISPVAENMASYTTIELCCDFPCIHCWYYNVYKTLCGFLNIVFLAWIFIVCVTSWNSVGLWLVQSWVMVGTKLGDCWCNVGWWLVQYWVMVGAMLGHGWHKVGWWLVQCWIMVGAMLGHGWYTVGSWLVHCWVIVGTMSVNIWCNVGLLLAYGWCNVGSLLVQCWLMVGTTLACSWHNVGLWLAQCWLIVGATLANYSWQNVGL